MLNEEIKNKALFLLEMNAGIDSWEEVGNTKEIAKPKHKVGDIIIFKACNNEDDKDGDLWKIDDFTPPFMFRSKQISKSKYKNISGIDKEYVKEIQNEWLVLCGKK